MCGYNGGRILDAIKIQIKFVLNITDVFMFAVSRNIMCMVFNMITYLKVL